MAALASAVIVSAPQAKTYTLSNAESVATNIRLGLSEEKPQAAVAQAITGTDPSADEKKIADYSGSERYRETDLQPGDTNQEFYNTDEKKEKDGFKFELNNPSETSPSKTKYGYQITINKKTGQRTYTKIYVTDSGRIPVEPGDRSMMNVGEKIIPESSEVTFKPGENTKITSSKTQRNLNYVASKETLKYINNKDNLSTSFGMKDDYTQDNPGIKFFAGNFSLGYKVNPWPNENDKLEELKLNKNNYDPTSKYFVQGQDIDTGIKVDNIDENAKERLVGQVYHPVTGEIVPGASVYIADDGNIHIKLPEGALKKDENGKTVINENSIFNTKEYKGIQQLDIKFFARPRTKDEFKKIANTPDDFGETGTYTETGAGTADINHKGENVTIDKQGIDRYDHYNLIGDFKLNLDDTRYYDQRFVDGNGDDTSKVTSSAVKPGEPFKVGIVQPENPSDTDKSADDMNGAQDRGEASGRLIMDFINRENKGKAPEDQWKVDLDPTDISNFTITPPKSAKAGDFVAIPVEYTYTNGSKDTHWFHFVVQESTYIKPEYDTQVNYPINKQTSPATWTEDGKRIPPSRFTLPDTLETDEAGNKLATDDKGNKWTVTVDETTGEVTAQPVNPDDFDGGEKLTVPVIAHYEDEQKPGEDITENVNAYFVIEEKANMTPRYNAKAGKEGDTLTSDVILNEEDRYNRRPGKYTIDSPTYTDDKGNVWNVSIDEKTGKVTATVPNPKEGQSIDGALLNVPVTAHYYEEDEDGNIVEAGTKKTEVQFVASGTDGTYVKKEDIPFETKVEKDPNLKKGEIKVITEGKLGSKEVTYVIKDSKIDESKTTEKILVKPEDRLIHVGEGTEDGEHKIEEKTEVPYEVEIQFDDTLKAGEQKVTQEGIPGEKTRNINLTIQDGKVTNVDEGEYTETKAPQKKIIKVGASTEGKVVHEEKIPFKYEISYDENLKSGEYVIDVPGTEGTRKTTWTIKNSEIVGEPEVETKDPVNAVIRVGKKDFTGTLETKKTKAIEFETEYKVDNSLEPGQVVVEQEGSLGEEETTVTHTIVNGEVTKSEKGTPTITKQPEKRIVKVGPGKTDSTHEIVEKAEVPFEVEIQFDDTLKPGEQKVTQEGVPGEKTRTTTLTIENSKVTKTEAGDFEVTKEPVKKIIKVGRNTEGKVEHKEEIPFGYKVEFDPNFHKNYPDATDNYQVVTKGVAGEKTTTWTIKNSEIVEGPTENIIKQPVDAVIKVGQKDYTGTFETKKTKAIEFETEYRVNNELKPGEVKEIQKGELGEEETTVTHTIVNGEVTKSEEGETKRTKAPVKRIVEVGPRATDGTHTYTNKIPFDVEVRVNPELKKGESKVIQKGEVGEEEYTITIENSKVTKTSEPVVTKEAKKEIIEVGSQEFEGEVKHTEEIPFGYKVEEVEDLKKGEYRIVKPGKVGTKTTTWTIKDSKVVGEPKEEIVEAEDALIQVGKGTNDGTHDIVEKKELPFETRYEYDDSLEAGEEKVVQEGKPGLQERTNTLVIKDGKVTKVKEGEFKTITEPEERIVKIGRKSTEGETTKTIEREIPYETKVIYDENLEAGFQKIENEGKPGKEEVTITQKIKDSKPVGDPTETTKTITEKEDRVVRIGVKPVVKEVELGNNTEYRHNPELKEGETKVIEEGSNGSIKYTTTFNKETGKLEVKEERTEPKNKVVEYGSKTDGEFTYESEKAYDIIIRENPELEAGKTNVIQEGIVGKTETTVKIENSKEVSRETKTITEKQDKIIEIGTKNVCEIPPVDPENPDKPVDPKDPETPGKDPKDPDQPGKPDEDPKDPEQPGGKDPKDPDQPGGEDPKDPEKPGEDPKDPEKPGEDPKDPEKPGKEDPKDPDQPGGEDPKDPEHPGKPGEEKPGKPGEEKQGKPGDKDPEKPGEDPKDPEQPDEKDPKDPETPGKTPENNGKTLENNGKTPGTTGQVDGKSTTTNNKTPKRLPKSGSESEIITLAMSGLLAAAGFIGLKKKRKDQ